MTRTTLDELKNRRLTAMSDMDRAEFDAAHGATLLALDVGEKIRIAGEEAGLSKRDLAKKMGTSQAAVARLETGGVGLTLTSVHRVAVALGRRITVDLSEAS